jgi:hypothetical protein
MKATTTEKARSILNSLYSIRRSFSNLSIAGFTCIILVSTIISSCGLHIEKRRYTKGFNISLNKKLKSSSEETSETNSNDLSQDNAPIKQTPYTITSVDSFEETELVSETTEQVEVYENALSSNEHKAIGAYSSQDKEAKFHSKSAAKKTTTIAAKKTKSPSNGDAQMLLIAGLVGVSSAAFINKKRKTTLRYTRWANKNKYKSRSMIVLAQLGLGYIGYSLGGYFKDMGYEISETSTYLVSGLSAATFLGMYVKEGTKRNMWDLKAFFREKSGHVVLSACLLGSSMGIGNGVSSNILQQGTMGQLVESIHHDNRAEVKSFQADELKISSQDIIENRVPYDKSEVAGVIVLYVILALILTVLLAVLSCAAICSYGEIGIVALIGSIIVLVVFNIAMNLWIHRIKQRA